MGIETIIVKRKEEKKRKKTSPVSFSLLRARSAPGEEKKPFRVRSQDFEGAIPIVGELFSS